VDMRAELPDLNCTCLTLRQASRHVSQAYDHHLRAVGLRNTQFSLIANLMGRTMTINELSERLIMDPTTLNRNLKPLLERGLVTVGVGEHDRRARAIMLTPAGRSLFELALPCWKAAQKTLRTAIGSDSREILHRLLRQVEAARLLTD
jgi:DNA-binding MarR family transcriptional regulator